MKILLNLEYLFGEASECAIVLDTLAELTEKARYVTPERPEFYGYAAHAMLALRICSFSCLIRSKWITLNCSALPARMSRPRSVPVRPSNPRFLKRTAGTELRSLMLYGPEAISVYVSPGSGMLLALTPLAASCHLITYQEAV